MVTLRRTGDDARIEIMPLIDVIFLLLTFFIYAMVLMIRAELLPVQMQAFVSGEPAQPAPAVTITLDGAGSLFVDRERVTLDTVLERLEMAKRRDPKTVIYLAAEEEGAADRLPTFLSLYDRLRSAGMEVKLVGRQDDEVDTAP
jgi:biopolymer transport protein ExbD